MNPRDYSLLPQQNVGLLSHNNLISRNILHRDVSCLLGRRGPVTSVGIDPGKIVRIFARKILQKICHLKSIQIFLSHWLQFILDLKVEYFVNKTETNTEHDHWCGGLVRPTSLRDQSGRRSS